MPRILLPVIADTAGHTVLKKPPGDIGPYQGRGGDVDLLCGSCHHMLAEHSGPRGLENIVLCAPICGSFNLAGPPLTDPARPADAGWAQIRSQDLRHP